MRKNVFGRQFSRTSNERKSLFKSLISSLILEESIKTTVEKAKSIKADVDKIINRAKRGNEVLATQLLQRSIGIEAMNKVIKDLAPRLKGRTSGYTRIVKLGRRFSDNAPMAIMEWVVKKEIKIEPKTVVTKVDAKEKIKKEVIKAKPEKKEVKKETKGKGKK